MASHGVPRVGNAEPNSEQAKKKESKKIEEYRALADLVESNIRERQYTLEILHLTSKLLTQNPEYYTIWNHRRRILQHHFQLIPSSDASTKLSPSDQLDTISTFITQDLQFLIPLLLKFPKCYWIWNHRSWLLSQSSRLLPASNALTFWQNELGLVAKMLGRDSRNFHGWGYRRKVVAALESRELNLESGGRSMVKEEFMYTTKMIETNLSNFSAWHNRSKLIPRLLNESGASDDERRAMLDSELSLIQDGLYTDPYDQSLWFYHNFLMCTFISSPSPTSSLESPSQSLLATSTIAPNLTLSEKVHYITSEIDKIIDMLEGAEDCKWNYQALIQLCIMYRANSGGEWPAPQAERLGVWMGELERLDPLRKGRWEDLKTGMGI